MGFLDNHQYARAGGYGIPSPAEQLRTLSGRVDHLENLLARRARSRQPVESYADAARVALRSIAEDATSKPLDRISAAQTLLTCGGGE